MAMAKRAIITPMGCFGGGLKRQNAIKFRFAAANIISMPMRMKIAWRRLSAASKPIENSAAETMRKTWRVGIMMRQIGDLESARLRRAGSSLLLLQHENKSAD